MSPERVDATEYGRERPEATTVFAPVAGSTRSDPTAPFSTTSSDPLGSTATEVGIDEHQRLDSAPHRHRAEP